MQLFEKSFRINYPELCKGRNVIIVDCTRVKADPGDDMSLRGHTGRHWKTVEKLVDHREFEDMNEPLKLLHLDKKNLVINVCVKGRHRSVANKECQFGALTTYMYNGNPAPIDCLDLQAQSHWKHLCRKACKECDMKSNRYKEAIRKGEKLIGHFVPERFLSKPPQRPNASATAASSGTVLAPTSKAAPKNPDTRPMSKTQLARIVHTGRDDETDSILKICENMVAKHPENAVIKVIQDALAVFRPGQSFFKTVAAHGSPAKVIEDLITKEDLHVDIFLKMFKAIREGEQKSKDLVTEIPLRDI